MWDKEHGLPLVPPAGPMPPGTGQDSEAGDFTSGDSASAPIPPASSQQGNRCCGNSKSNSSYDGILPEAERGFG